MSNYQISINNEVKRKLVHLSSVWMLGAIYFIPYKEVQLLMSTILLGMILFEISVRYISSVRYLILKYARNIFRSKEISKDNISLTSSSYFVLGVVLAVYLFSKEITITSIAILIFADTAAALIGKRYGKIKILDKSLEGSSTFFFVAFVILYLSMQFLNVDMTLYKITYVSFIVTIAELFAKKIKLDDNLLIVLLSGLLLTI